MSSVLRQIPGAVPGVLVGDPHATEAQLQTIAQLSRVESDYVAGQLSAHRYLLLVAVIVRRHFASLEATHARA